MTPGARDTTRDTARDPGSEAENRVLDAAKRCCERWGVQKVTIDDIATDAGVSRATLYRLFPGGKDVLFDALRLRELEDFFTRMSADVDGHADLESLLVRMVVAATRELRGDRHLALMLAAEPGETLSQLTVAGIPRIVRVASQFLVPLVEQYLPRRQSVQIVEVLSRLVISYFLAPSDVVDFGDPASVRHFVRTFLPAYTPALTRS